MANKKWHRTYTCELTELMKTAYPNRKDGIYFSLKEKVEFYQDLRKAQRSAHFYGIENGCKDLKSRKAGADKRSE